MIHQRSLFDDGSPDVVELLDQIADGGEVVYIPRCFAAADGDRLFAELERTTVWRQDRIRMFGKESPVPRLTAWHGEPHCEYTYSHITMQPTPWTPALREVKARVEAAANTTFNCVLLNLYRHGGDGVAWHSDDEPELGTEPTLASVSFGGSRRFQLRRRDDRTERRELELAHGSLLLMSGTTQEVWEHQVPKTSRPVQPRINLTFRRIDEPVT